MGALFTILIIPLITNTLLLLLLVSLLICLCQDREGDTQEEGALTRLCTVWKMWRTTMTSTWLLEIPAKVSMSSDVSTPT